MEELNKTQLVLLAIFITLVTSSATGVIVVTLMDQSPQGVTQTINRVVERTVERVVAPGKVEKTEVTQIVREDDNIISSIKKAKQSLVRIYHDNSSSVAAIAPSDSINTAEQSSLIDTAVQNFQDQTASLVSSLKFAETDGSRIGFLVSSDGFIITTNDIVSGSDTNYTAVLYNDIKVPVVFLKSDDTRGISLFKADISKLKEKIVFVPLIARSYDQVSLGQTVIAMGFDAGLNTVSMGYVSGMKAGSASSTPVIKTNIKTTENWSGRPIIDTNGFLVGVYGLNNEIISYQSVKNLIDSFATST